ncbi:hypothetical protein ACFFMR_08370 [Micromonospora andamanensis]|uniref:SPW_0924 family protein n=1 Tax=Micromonospora andamanensis TaxID=1287068 RepID=A0ABQ4HXQ3_9ACTN|nr:hypothetical protein [Micromonospora andamanensis]GIJ10407.1 hypothetical protein Van01_36210 [Micromonospora andamanensis]GIJ37961.1 hypothetical protein Vwe01_12860 [Micromonospora andamanensis]
MVGSAARELLLVIAVAAVGLLLATALAFAPWPVTPGGSAPSGLVDLHGPVATDRTGSASG